MKLNAGHKTSRAHCFTEGTPTFYERAGSSWHPAGQGTTHSLLRGSGLSHFESVKHDSNHRANHGENDGPLDKFFL
jgi:hypothetical protein